MHYQDLATGVSCPSRDGLSIHTHPPTPASAEPAAPGFEPGCSVCLKQRIHTPCRLPTRQQSPEKVKLKRLAMVVSLYPRQKPPIYHFIPEVIKKSCNIGIVIQDL